ncbi:hypothetical protein E2P81_ATG08489 [Venturia nashicola]|uniref:Heterokaryon incompatibility domain-containing protein n=1 Tax=Venturia nashicola TaxID=86259 RepID=A0A4Z1NGQ1_9PEZI|nr:hypothetical protein E6O75_ATG08683 [Venturia nashicola]TLD20825.1 hypothetical protein E2P81_ATG08489 [Venturia nashicola]
MYSLLRLFLGVLVGEKRNVDISKSVYQPLTCNDTIRVLIIEPGALETPIRCRLAHQRLGEKLPYEALSYVWGPESPAYEITVNGNVFVIRENLYHALQQLRLETRSRMLWVDAISINQKDVPERNHQVQQMKRIYESANRTLVWLGRPQIKDQNAAQLLLGAEEANQKDPKIDVVKFITDQLCPIVSSCSMNKALSAFFSNDWFTRVWIIQEFAVASDVRFVYGRTELASATVHSAAIAGYSNANNMYYSLGYTTYQRRKIFRLRDIQRNNLRRYPLASLLYMTFGKVEASDPRDYIFSLLGLVEDAERDLVSVDYDASIKTVYIKTMTQCIIHDPQRTFDLLSLVGYFPRRRFRKSLPSWVPDFSSPFGSRRSFSNKGDFSASLRSEIGIVVGGKILTIQGRIVDTTETCLDYPFGTHEEVSPSDWRTWHQRCRDLGTDAGVFYETADFEEVWWRLLVCDRYFDLSVQKYKTAREGYLTYYLDPEILHQEYITDQDCTRRDAEFLDMQKRYSRTKRLTSSDLNFCSTRKGLLGWLPQAAKEGDNICIFAGANAPFVIRDRRNGTYELLGDAYIHGIMYGEALQWEDSEWKDIKLT